MATTTPNKTKFTALISLISVEVGINVEGVQKVANTKCGRWNKRGGWDFLEKTSTLIVKLSNDYGILKMRDTSLF